MLISFELKRTCREVGISDKYLFVQLLTTAMRSLSREVGSFSEFRLDCRQPGHYTRFGVTSGWAVIRTGVFATTRLLLVCSCGAGVASKTVT
jgi:hypothetical protein